MKMNPLITILGVALFTFQDVPWSVFGDGISGHPSPQFTFIQCNNTAICAISEPVAFLYSVLSLTMCAAECYFKQYLSAPCVGFNYRATNYSCDIFNDDSSLFYSKDQVGCQYYQRATNTNFNCTTEPGLQSNTLVSSIVLPGHVLATAIHNGQLFVTVFNSSKVFVYDTTSYQQLRTFALTIDSTRLFGLAASATNNYLFVSDVDNQCVHRVDLSVTSRVSVVSWTMFSTQPYGLSMTSAGNLLVVVDYATGTIGEYTPGGLLVRKIVVNRVMWHAVEVSSDVWAFSSLTSNKNGICTSFRNGSMIKCYGGQMKDPRWLAVDSRGYIIVADQDNNRILVVNPSLTDSRPLSLPANAALQVPICLSLDKSRGQLYVGEDGGKQRVLVLDGI